LIKRLFDLICLGVEENGDKNGGVEEKGDKNGDRDGEEDGGGDVNRDVMG
jgi:hypothetical protein